jgi:hypothetical protein
MSTRILSYETPSSYCSTAGNSHITSVGNIASEPQTQVLRHLGFNGVELMHLVRNYFRNFDFPK